MYMCTTILYICDQCIRHRMHCLKFGFVSWQSHMRALIRYQGIIIWLQMLSENGKMSYDKPSVTELGHDEETDNVDSVSELFAEDALFARFAGL